MKKMLVRSVFVLGLVSGFGVGMAQPSSQPSQPSSAAFCNDYNCNLQCKRAGFTEGACNADSDCECSQD
ncbi:hypothetical protein P2318_10525 [Myxococcaceae bacterium GXIMD 01537]